MMTSIAEAEPILAAQADGWDPSQYGPGSNKDLPWRCQDCDYRWTAKPYSRRRTRSCPACTGEVIIAGRNDFATRFPDAAATAYGWDPSTVGPFTHAKRAFKCPVSTCAQVYEMGVNKRSVGQGCPFCAGKRIAVGVNDLATTHPALVAEADGWDPTTVTAGSAKRVAWRCRVETCQWVWTTQVCNRSLQDTGCPVCTNRIVVEGTNDLATTHPEIAAQAMGQWNPREYTAGSDFQGRWQCPDSQCLFQWETSISHRTSGRGCPDCARMKRSGLPRLVEANPALADEALLWDPRFVTHKSRMVLRWKCSTCAYVWRAQVVNRANGSGCPRCATSGYDTSALGWVYLLTRERYGRTVLKVGITNNLQQRNRSHVRAGWTVREVSSDMSGVEAKAIETAVLSLLDGMGVARGYAAFGTHFDGYTESWWEDAYPVGDLPTLTYEALAEASTPRRKGRAVAGPVKRSLVVRPR